jgi:hypothetical protein
MFNKPMTKDELRSRLEKQDFEMFSEKGNERCRKLVREAWTFIESDKKMTEIGVFNFVDIRMKKFPQQHREVFDTEPRSHIENYVNKMLELEGYNFSI